MRPLHFALAALALAAAPPTLADSRLVFHDSSDDSESVIFVKDGVVRMEDRLTADDENFVLFDSHRRVMTIIDHDEHSYHEMSEETVDSQVEMMEGAMLEMAEELARQLNSLPPDERRMMEEQMAALGVDLQSFGPGNALQEEGQQPTFRRTGRSDRVAGISCEVVEALIEGRVTEELCLAGRGALAIPAADHEAVAVLMDFMARISATMGAAFGMKLGAEAELPVKGIPIRIRDIGEESVLTLREFSSQDLDSALFLIPAGYEMIDPH